MTMRALVIAAILLISPDSRVSGQALDLGGIELRLGDDVSDALKALSTYNVRYHDGLKGWFVSQNAADDAEWLGNFSATSGKVSFISKVYRVPTNEDIARIYTQAWRDTKRRGGQSCRTEPVEFTDELIHQIDTRCGRYRLTLSLPYRLPSGERVATGISLNVGAK